jgi:(p)ppGpp synthase/HD superfamily hydrolase
MFDRMLFLHEAENRESFLRRIALLFPRSDYRFIEIERAYDLVKDAFRGKYRDDGITRYFEHIRAVALILIDYLRVKDHRIIIAALLHDIVEDIPSWNIERVRLEFGEYVASLVDYLTKPSKDEYPLPEEREHVYHFRFRSAPREFFLIKLSDRLHNIITLGTCPSEKRARKIAETKKHYVMYAEEHFILYHELLLALERLETVD